MPAVLTCRDSKREGLQPRANDWPPVRCMRELNEAATRRASRPSGVAAMACESWTARV